MGYVEPDREQVALLAVRELALCIMLCWAGSFLQCTDLCAPEASQIQCVDALLALNAPGVKDFLVCCLALYMVDVLFKCPLLLWSYLLLDLRKLMHNCTVD